MSVSVAPGVPGTKPGRVLGCATGSRPGPTLVIVGGLHGNEHAGLIASERVFERLDRESLPERGRVLAMRGNLAALVTCDPKSRGCPRYIDTDLNRLFLHGSDDGCAGQIGVEHIERREIEALLESEVAGSKGTTYLIDLHTVSSDSPPFVAVEDSLPARKFAMAFPLPKILGIEEELHGLLMDDATNRLGCISVVIESGRHDDPMSVDIHEAAIWIALDAAGIVPLGVVDLGYDPRRLLCKAARGRADHVYEIRFLQTIRDRDFSIKPGMDAFVRVKSRRTEIATEAGQTLITPASGLLFMPNRQPDPRPGDDAYFVIRRVGRIWLSVSAMLRTRPWVHALLARLLPGVRQRPGCPHDLLVAPNIAVILQRQVFHLFGYRVIRRGPLRFARVRTRLFRAIKAVVRSMQLQIMGVFRDGRRTAKPIERPDDWIVRRRALDTGCLWNRADSR